MNTFNLIKEKVKILKQINYYIINVIGDESLIELWLMNGVPDGATEEDYLSIVTDKELWLGCVQTFDKICKRVGIYK